jgi:hypothetical protein
MHARFSWRRCCLNNPPFLPLSRQPVRSGSGGPHRHHGLRFGSGRIGIARSPRRVRRSYPGSPRGVGLVSHFSPEGPVGPPKKMKTFPRKEERTAEPQIFPLRCAPVEMTKGRAVLPGTIVAEQDFSTEGSWTCGPPKVMKSAPVQRLLSLEAPPSPLSSRPKRSEVERSAVQRSLLGNVFRQRW